MSNGEAERRQSVLQMQGLFDVRAAQRVVEYLEGTRGQGPVRVDLTKITEFRDSGVAVLAQALKQMTWVRARLVGLRTHQVRMLKYFGLEASHLPQA